MIKGFEQEVSKRQNVFSATQKPQGDKITRSSQRPRSSQRTKTTARSAPTGYIKKAAFIFSLSFFLFSLCFSVFAQILSIDEALDRLGGGNRAELRWDPFFASGTLVSEGYEAAFISGQSGESGMVLLDHREIMNLPLPYLEDGNLRFPENFINQIRNSFRRYAEEDSNRYRIAGIVIDPGHGGRDPGTVWDYRVNGRDIKVVEKDIVLDVAKQVHSMLSASFPDKQVLLTRDTDIFLSLDERVELANTMPLASNEAVIYISIHANSSLNRNARGFEVWYLSPNYRRDLIDRSRFAGSNNEVIPILNSMLEEELTTESILLANSILRRMVDTAGRHSPNRGLKAAEWFVVRNARMPSVLVELGFLSNEAEAILMSDEAYLKNLSEAVYKGISDFVAFFERSGGFTTLR
ncbi:MAG: N-acetylmuramoyl-L-alanine amidase [Treponema sp.]|nr:N-acetylmuramoyl-L-alanine amidase [Treponema sp.]